MDATTRFLEVKEDDPEFYQRQIIYEFLEYEKYKFSMTGMRDEILTQYLELRFPDYINNRIRYIQNHYFHQLLKGHKFETIFTDAKPRYEQLYYIILKWLRRQELRLSKEDILSETYREEDFSMPEIKLKNDHKIDKTTFYARLINEQVMGRPDFKIEFFRQLEYLYYNLVKSLYELKEIQIDEINILYGEKDAVDVAKFEDDTIDKCLKRANNILFVQIDKRATDYISFNYHAVCYSKKDILEVITKKFTTGSYKYPCNSYDRRVYIALPIGANARNVYIPLLSALLLLQSDKRIFYVLRKDSESYYSQEGEEDLCEYKIGHDKPDDKIPIAYIAKCSGSNCAPKIWRGSRTDNVGTRNEFIMKAREEDAYVKRKEREAERMRIEEERMRIEEETDSTGGIGKVSRRTSRQNPYPRR